MGNLLNRIMNKDTEILMGGSAVTGATGIVYENPYVIGVGIVGMLAAIYINNRRRIATNDHFDREFSKRMDPSYREGPVELKKSGDTYEEDDNK